MMVGPTNQQHQQVFLAEESCYCYSRPFLYAGGEGDLRACYTAMAVAHMLNFDKEDLAARSGVADFVRRCQVSLQLFVPSLGKQPAVQYCH